MKLARSVFRYRGKENNDEEIADALRKLVEEQPDLGFKKYFRMLRNRGKRWNHKLVRRIYNELNLNKRSKKKRRLPVRNPDRLEVPAEMNDTWSCDFMSDALTDSRRFRTFNVLDDFNREGLKIEIDFSLSAERVVRVLTQIAEVRGLPKRLRMDNGPEFVSGKMAEWCETTGVKPEFIEPGKPQQNAYIERFNRSFRQGVLNMYLFDSLDDAREITAVWLDKYNNERPHDALGGIPPSQYGTQRNA